MKPTMTPRSLADIHNVLSSESRLKMLRALAVGPLSVGELAERTDISTSAASQHLSKLKAAGLVDFRRNAQTLHYFLAAPIHEVLSKTLDLIGEG